MLWQTAWEAISARIVGLVEAGRVIEGVADQSVTRRSLHPYTDDVFKTLREFDNAHRSVLPSNAASCLRKFMETWEQYYSTALPGGENTFVLFIRERLAVLAAFRSEFTYYISDFSAVAKRLSERAFIHLQSCINADSSTKQRWIDAFKGKGEPACEKLGAAHLLLHGIWAFKAHADAPGERTDLVLGEPTQSPFDLATVAKVADALILTEWKCVKTYRELERKRSQAYEQANRYGQGALAGIELANYRYLIMVSEQYFSMPEDICDVGITYHAINIAVNPDSPSKAARSMRRQTKPTSVNN